MRGGPFVDVEELQVPSARACELVRSQLMVPAIRNVVNLDKLLTGKHEKGVPTALEMLEDDLILNLLVSSDAHRNTIEALLWNAATQRFQVRMLPRRLG